MTCLQLSIPGQILALDSMSLVVGGKKNKRLKIWLPELDVDFIKGKYSDSASCYRHMVEERNKCHLEHLTPDKPNAMTFCRKSWQAEGNETCFVCFASYYLCDSKKKKRERGTKAFIWHSFIPVPISKGC